MSTIIVVQADLKGDPSDLIKAFQESEKAARDFAAKTRQQSQSVKTSWDAVVTQLTDAQKATKAFGDKTTEIGQSLNKNITKPALIAGTAVAGIAAIGGWNRLVAIENATKQIESLGYSAVDAANIINTDVLAAVEGTAFSLAEAGTQAGAALAAGIKPGAELTAQLKLIGDATTRSTTDFASMAEMLNRVEGSGKLTTDMVNRFTENGLFVLPMLQKEFGKTADEIRDMVTRGEIDSKTFAKILEENVGGAALLSGDTAQGAFANMRTAISNLGATALSDVFPLIKDAMMDLTAVFKSPEIKESLKQIGAIIADVFTQAVSFIKDAITWFSALDPGMQSFLLGLAAAAVAAGPILIIVGKLATGVSALIGVFGMAAGVVRGFALATQGAAAVQAALTGATKGMAAAIKIGTAIQWLWNAALTANPIGLIVTAIGAVVAALIWFFTQTDLGREIWANFTKFLTEAWNNIVSVATTVWTAVSGFFVDLWNGIVETFTGAWSTISGFVTSVWTNISTFFSDLWATVTGVFTAAWEGIVAFLTPIFEFIAALVKVYIEVWVNIFLVFAAVLKTIWDGIVAVVTTVWNAIVEFLTPIITAIVDFIVSYFTSMFEFWSMIWTAVSDFFTTVWNAIVSFITPIVTAIGDFIIGVFTAVADWWNGMWEGVQVFFANVWMRIQIVVATVLAQIQGVITSVVSAISSWWSGVWNGISSFFKGIWDKMVATVRSAVDWIGSVIRTVKDTVMGVFNSVGTWLYTVGKQLIEGFWNGISSMWNWITSQIGGFFDGIIGWAKDTLGIASPSKVFAQLGRYTGEGFAVGLKGTTKQVTAAANSMISKLRDAMSAGAISQKTGNSLISQVSKETNRIKAQITAREKVLVKLKAAQDKYADLVKDRDKYAADVREKVVSMGNVAKGGKTAESITANLKAQVAKAKSFQTTIAELKKMGLDQTSLDQLMQEFMSSGKTTAADAIKAGGPAAVKEIVGLQKELDKTGAGLGKTMAATMYQAGIDSAAGMVKGLQSQATQLAKAGSAIGDALVKSVKKQLGIKSPSRVMMDVAYDTTAGLSKGLADSRKMVVDASMNLIPVVPDPKSLTSAWDPATGTGTYGTPPWAPPAQSTGTTINLTVEVKADGAQAPDIDDLVRKVVDAIRFELGGTVTVG